MARRSLRSGGALAALGALALLLPAPLPAEVAPPLRLGEEYGLGDYQ